MEKEIFIKTIVYLGIDIVSSYSAIYTASDKSRGPMIYYNEGKWLNEFRYLLDKHNIGIVGASSICENKRLIILPHMYAFRTSILKSALHASKPLNSTTLTTTTTTTTTTTAKQLFKILKGGIEKIVKSVRLKLSSVLHYKRYNQISFEGECPELMKTTYDNRNVNMQQTNSYRNNPTYWCDVMPHEVIFYKWGGVPMRPPLEICDKQLIIVANETEKISLYNPQAKLHIPESMFSGILHDLNHDYNYEKYKNKHITLISKASLSLSLSQSSPLSSTSLSSSSHSSSSHSSTSHSSSSSSSHSSPSSLKKYPGSNITYIPYQSTGPKVCLFAMYQ